MPSSKQELRSDLKKQLDGLSARDIRERSARACDHLAEQPEFQRAEIIMVFLSLPQEINTTPLVLKAWLERKRVLAPRINWDQCRMLPIEIRSLKEDVEETEYQLRQPTPGNPVPVEMIDLIVVPGLAFDAAGHRLGRGRGFYDRFLSKPQCQAVACAMGFEEQVVPAIPTNADDVPVHMLVTDDCVRRFAREPSSH